VPYKFARGYFWYFPLACGRGYVGAGDIDRVYYGVREFLRNHPEANIIKKIGRPIRIAPPRRMEPFYFKNVIGVGESIGCVFPLVGEGIIPTLICCELFMKSFDQTGEKFNFDKYRKDVLRRFGYYDEIYKFVRLKMTEGSVRFGRIALSVNIYKDTLRPNKRYGISFKPFQIKRVLDAL
jgi:flavin-dependent dehydrogenase